MWESWVVVQFVCHPEQADLRSEVEPPGAPRFVFRNAGKNRIGASPEPSILGWEMEIEPQRPDRTPALAGAEKPR
jgi:hypothetical protein